MPYCRRSSSMRACARRCFATTRWPASSASAGASDLPLPPPSPCRSPRLAAFGEIGLVPICAEPRACAFRSDASPCRPASREPGMHRDGPHQGWRPRLAWPHGAEGRLSRLGAGKLLSAGWRGLGRDRDFRPSRGRGPGGTRRASRRDLRRRPRFAGRGRGEPLCRHAVRAGGQRLRGAGSDPRSARSPRGRAPAGGAALRPVSLIMHAEEKGVSPLAVTADPRIGDRRSSQSLAVVA